MGRVRTKTVKKSAKVIIERYYPKLSLDFETNKRICDEIAIIASKRLRNKIAGYTTHLMKVTFTSVHGQTVLTAISAYPTWSCPRYLLQAPRRGA
jgi:ribosomal protein S17E